MCNGAAALQSERVKIHGHGGAATGQERSNIRAAREQLQRELSARFHTRKCCVKNTLLLTSRTHMARSFKSGDWEGTCIFIDILLSYACFNVFLILMLFDPITDTQAGKNHKIALNLEFENDVISGQG